LASYERGLFVISKELLDVLQVLVGCGTIVSLIVAIISLKLANDAFQRQMNAQVYLAYTERFEKLASDCPSEFRLTYLRMRIEDVPSADKSRVLACLIRYLNLCSEERHLLQSGYLAPAVWKSWERDLEETIRTVLYRTAWPQLRCEYRSYPEFIGFVERIQGHREQEQK
jgi:hypothetical protein